MKHFVVMGVSGCGKSTVAEMLAQRLNGSMIEADELHSAKSIEKMHEGIALCDEDRWPWLIRVASSLRDTNTPVFVSCSALRQTYRQCLLEHAQVSIGFIHLHANEKIIKTRLSNREGHFMPVSLLESQVQTLEPLQCDETGVVVDIAQPIDKVVEEAVRYVKRVMHIKNPESH